VSFLASLAVSQNSEHQSQQIAALEARCAHLSANLVSAAVWEARVSECAGLLARLQDIATAHCAAASSEVGAGSAAPNEAALRAALLRTDANDCLTSTGSAASVAAAASLTAADVFKHASQQAAAVRTELSALRVQCAALEGAVSASKAQASNLLQSRRDLESRLSAALDAARAATQREADAETEKLSAQHAVTSETARVASLQARTTTSRFVCLRAFTLPT
jgi:hypothetical protein